jgi:NADPH2:quinone reductase
VKAVGAMSFGGPEALELLELPDPVPGEGEVRIKVRAAAVNPTDTYVVKGAITRARRELGPPFVPGMDVAGTIDMVGPGTDSRLAVGQDVVAIVFPLGSVGGYSEFVVVSRDSVVPMPSAASFAQAATLPMNGLTARLTLDRLALEPGQSLAVTGSAGTYGGYVVQLALLDDLDVVADASADDRELVTGLGARTVLARGGDYAKRVRAAFPDGVVGLADGAVLGEDAMAAVADGGGFAAVRKYHGAVRRGIELDQIWVDRYLAATEKLAELVQHVDNELLTLRVADTYNYTEATRAHHRLAAGGVRGRLVLEF